MVIGHSFNPPPHQRQNRRRERPSSRVRRSSARKSHLQSNIQDDFHEGLLDARDTSVSLPSDNSKPSPLLRQNFDQSWQRWKERQAEEKAVAEMDRMQLEQEQIRLFGGDVDDGELYRLGILYNKDVAQSESDSSVTLDISLQQTAPMFVLRPCKQSKRSRTRRPIWRTLPLHLSLSDLSKDTDIARLLSPTIPNTPKIQHHDDFFTPITNDIDISQSLPPTPALKVPNSSSHLLDNTHSVSSLHVHFDLNPGDWTFISTAPHSTQVSPPCSEPETWILLSDDS